MRRVTSNEQRSLWVRAIKNRILIALTFVCFLILGAVWLSYNYETRDWIKFRLFYRDYLSWKKEGGEIKDKFYEPLKLDRYRDSMVEGLTYEQIVMKFPFLIDGESYPKDTYKGEYLEYARNYDSINKILWFHKEDGFDWCIVIKSRGNEIRLIKG